MSTERRDKALTAAKEFAEKAYYGGGTTNSVMIMAQVTYPDGRRAVMAWSDDEWDDNFLAGGVRPKREGDPE